MRTKIVKKTFYFRLKNNRIYKPCEIKKVLTSALKNVDIVYKNEHRQGVKKPCKVDYYNIPVSFDIETTSFYNDGMKSATMYVWMFNINGYTIIGRTWEQYFAMLNEIEKELSLSVDKRLVIYVHNLAYEFQFLRNWCNWFKVFALDKRKPVYAITNTGIEYRCSYLLSGYSLKKVGENLNKYKISKMSGDLDYSLIRNNKTHLTRKEVGYCVNDVKVVVAYIKECMERDGNIAKILMTKTGYVREFCRNNCFYTSGKQSKKDYKKMRYLQFIHNLRITSAGEYKQLKRAFMGGFTHASPYHACKTLENVSSDDFTSSYPTVMVAEQFPMSTGQLVDVQNKADFENNLKNYCCLFDVYFEDLEPKIWYENYLSFGRCRNVVNPVVSNGRIVTADSLVTTITDVDFTIIKAFYKWSKIKIANFRRYARGYLPTDMVKSILKLYELKTTLKGVKGKEVEYLKGKENLNACYGMMVTDIIRDCITYTDGWDVDTPDITKAINDYNNSNTRFLFYPWGVWVTAYARRNLFTGIIEFKEDYVYSDTDSIKSLNRDKHIDYINTYNKVITTKLKKAMEWHKLPLDLLSPVTVEGDHKPLGVWDFEGTYSRFKTLGAKRYMVEKDGEINITVSGLNKNKTVPYLIDKYGKNVFDKFDNNLYIPAGYTGKSTHTYIDTPIDGLLADYNGTVAEFHEKSYIHLEESDYSLGLDDFVDYLLSVQETDIS